MSIEKDLEKIIGKIWFVKDNFKSISKNKVLIKRVEYIQDIVRLVAKYNPKRVVYADRLVLNNYIGSIQRYLTGYDLTSIHLSSKSLEIAFLLKIGKPSLGEKYGSFGQICDTVINRKLIKQKHTEDKAWNVVNRRNMTMHDAILEQAVLWIYSNWIQQKLNEIPEKNRRLFKMLIKPLMSKIQNELKNFDSLPDLRWYVSDKSFESTKNLIIDFLEQTFGQILLPLKKVEDRGFKAYLSKIPEVMNKAIESIRYDSFLNYTAIQNLNDVKIVLEECYDSNLFRF